MKGIDFRPSLERLEARDQPAILNWIAAGPGDFNDPRNWDGRVVPGSGDTAILGRPDAIVSAASGTIAASVVSLRAGTLAGKVTLDGNLDWTGGRVAGTGGVVVEGRFVAGGSNAKALDGGYLVLEGGGSLAGTTVLLSSAAEIVNASGSTLLLGKDSRFEDVGKTGSFVNEGLLLAVGPARLPTTVNSGVLAIPAGESITPLEIDGDLTLEDGSVLALQVSQIAADSAHFSIIVTGTTTFAGRIVVDWQASTDEVTLVLFLKSGTIQGSVSSDVDSNVSDTLTIFPRLLGTRAGLLAVPSDVAFTLFGGSVSNLRALLLGLDDGLLISAEELPINLGPNIGRDTQQAMAALSNRPLSMLVLLGDDVRLFTRFGDSGATDPAEAAARARAATSAGSAGAGVAGPPPVLSPPPDLSGLPLENLAAATADEAIRLLTGLRPRSDLLTQSGRQVAPVATLLGGTAPADGPGPAMRPADAPPPDDLPALLINPAAPPTRPDLSSALLDPMLALPLLVRVRTLNGRDESEAAGRQR